MYVARILYPVKVLGPGNRIGIWVSGCIHKCKGCSNPELWDFNEKYNRPLSVITELIKTINSENIIDGFTITGGDPFEQADELKILLESLKKINDDILVYTGYEYSYIKNKYNDIIKLCTVIIDGKYIEERNTQKLLIGSDNQNIYIVNDNYRVLYDNYLKTAKSEIQNFMAKDGIISVGIHKKDYEKELSKRISAKGIVDSTEGEKK